MNSQGQVSLPNLLNAFHTANVPVNAYQLVNNLGGSNQPNYSMSSVNTAVSKLGLNQDQLNAVRQSLGNGPVNPTAPVAASSQWWNTAPVNNSQIGNGGNNAQLNSGSLLSNLTTCNGTMNNGTAMMANGQSLNYGGPTAMMANGQSLNYGGQPTNNQFNSGSLMSNGNGQPSGSDWVVVMNSDTFLQLAQSGAMQF